LAGYTRKFIPNHIDIHCQRTGKSALPITALVARPLLVPAFKVSAKNGLFLGQIIWVKLVVLEARLRPVEQLDKDVEIGCRLSWTYD
jgi:hypothetical protein